MSGRILRLGRPEVAAMIDERYASEPDGWRKRRLLAVKLAAKGEYTSAEVAELCGIARSRLFVWLGCVREKGLEALLQRQKPGPKEGTWRGVQPEVIAALAERLGANQFASAEAARRRPQVTWTPRNVRRPRGLRRGRRNQHARARVLPIIPNTLENRTLIG